MGEGSEALICLLALLIASSTFGQVAWSFDELGKQWARYEKVPIYPKKKAFSFGHSIFFPYLCTNYICQEIQIQM